MASQPLPPPAAPSLILHLWAVPTCLPISFHATSIPDFLLALSLSPQPLRFAPFLYSSTGRLRSLPSSNLFLFIIATRHLPCLPEWTSALFYFTPFLIAASPSSSFTPLPPGTYASGLTGYWPTRVAQHLQFRCDCCEGCCGGGSGKAYMRSE